MMDGSRAKGGERSGVDRLEGGESPVKVTIGPLKKGTHPQKCGAMTHVSLGKNTFTPTLGCHNPVLSGKKHICPIVVGCYNPVRVGNSKFMLTFFGLVFLRVQVCGDPPKMAVFLLVSL